MLSTRSALAAAIIAGGVAAALVPAAAEAPNWQVYEDFGLGYRLLYPAHLFGPPRLAERAEGVTLTAPDLQARLHVFGGRNVLGHNPRSLADELSRLEDVEAVTYRRVAGDWLVLSGYLRGGEGVGRGDIFYERVEFNRDRSAMSGFRIEYPASQRGTFDHLIGRIGRSLTPPRAN